jgi:hypothetical protein
VAIEAARPRPRLPPTGVTFAARGEASGSVDRGGSAVTGGGPLEDQLEVLAPRLRLDPPTHTAMGAAVARPPAPASAGALDLKEPDSAERRAHRRAARGPLTSRCHFLVSGTTKWAASGQHMLMHPDPAIGATGRAVAGRFRCPVRRGRAAQAGSTGSGETKVTLGLGAARRTRAGTASTGAIGPPLMDSMTCHSGVPMATSPTRWRLTSLVKVHTTVPGDSGVPVERNHSAPWATMSGTLAIVSTLLTNAGPAPIRRCGRRRGDRPGRAVPARERASTVDRLEHPALLAEQVLIRAFEHRAIDRGWEHVSPPASRPAPLACGGPRPRRTA